MVKKFASLFAILFLFASNSSSVLGTVNEPNDNSALGSTVEFLRPGTHLYHWGGKTSILKKIEISKKICDGTFEASHFQEIASKSGTQGSGIYTSLDPWDTAGYGPNLLIFTLTASAPIVNFKRQYSSEDDYTSGKILATYLGVSSIALYGQEPDSYCYIAVKNPALTQDIRLANSSDILDLINSTSPPELDRDAIIRLIRLSNLKEVSLDEIHWDWSKYPIAKKLITREPLNSDEKNRYASFPPDRHIFSAADPEGIQIGSAPNNQVALSLAENFYNDQQVVIFLLNLNRINLVNDDNLIDLLSFTKQFPRLLSIAKEKIKLLNRIADLMRSEKDNLLSRDTNERIYNSLLHDRDQWIRLNTAQILASTEYRFRRGFGDLIMSILGESDR